MLLSENRKKPVNIGRDGLFTNSKFTAEQEDQRGTSLFLLQKFDNPDSHGIETEDFSLFDIEQNATVLRFREPN